MLSSPGKRLAFRHARFGDRDSHRLESRELMLYLLPLYHRTAYKQLQQQLVPTMYHEVPGLLGAQCRHNPAQDARIAIRGTAPFRFRHPAGYSSWWMVCRNPPRWTGQVDNIDPGVVPLWRQFSDIFRIIWHAAGGAINFTTEARRWAFCRSPLQRRQLRLPAYQLKGGQVPGRLGLLTGAIPGLRDTEHSRMESSMFNTRLHFDYGKREEEKEE